MKITRPYLITEKNLSIAWARAFLHVHMETDDALIVALRDFDSDIPLQDAEISTALDEKLTSLDVPRIDHTALTIVPYERWLRQGKVSIEELSDWYLKHFLPRLKARCLKNRHGTYFERFISYSGIKQKDGKWEVNTVNQIAYVINFWKNAQKSERRPRRSALQLSCFDPAKDDNGAALAGFPCLQQVSFTYHEAGSLELSAYYPTQYLLERAYGNYLGLCQLGHMVAHSLGVKLTRFTCFVAQPELGKSPGRDFVEKIRALADRHPMSEIE